MTETSRPRQTEVLIPIAIGGIFFFIIAGHAILLPGNIAWLSIGDPSTHYLGWVFYARSEWSFPVGLNPSYGLELGNAIIFSDSNPLLSIILKPFYSLLEFPFQFFGPWILLCFVLQAYFGWKLVGLATSDIAIKALATCIFAVSPPMIWRLNGHISLASHFIVLCALYLCLQPVLSRRRLKWAALLAVAALVHAYFLVMILALWLADGWGRVLNGQLNRKDVATENILLTSLTAAICWQAGYLSVGKGASSGGFGFYRANLLSLFDASGWSYVLPDLPQGPGDYEGFGYLGAGTLLLALFALVPGLKNKHKYSDLFKNRILLLTLGGLALYAASNNIGILEYGIKIDVGKRAQRLFDVFRASGRMLWPLFYFVVTYILYVLCKTHTRSRLRSLLLVAALVQAVDTSAGWVGIRKWLAQPASSEWASPLADPFWEAAARRYKKVRWIMPENHSPAWSTIAAYAARRGLSTDAVYLARIDSSALARAQSDAATSLSSGTYEPDSLYVIDERYLLRASANLRRESDLLVEIDGFNVLAPGWRKCSECPTISAPEISVGRVVPIPVPGDTILFNGAGSGTAYLLDGWSLPEEWGTWSAAESAIILVPRRGHVRSLTVRAEALITEMHPRQRVQISIDGTLATTAVLTQNGDNLIELELPEGEAGEIRDFSLVEFVLPDAVRPLDIGLNNDVRRLAFGLKSISFN
jgi:hypothetical protein